MERGFIRLNIAVLAVSEGGGDATKLLVDRLDAAGHAVTAAPIADSVQLLRARLLEQIADAGVDVVIVLAPLESDAAGHALAPLVTHRLQGFSDLLRMIAYQEIGSAAMLVDAEAARCKSTFVFVLPAQPAQVKLALDKLLLPQLDYRTRPKNLVMQIPRIAHDDRGDDAVVTPASDHTTAPMPWIVPRSPGEPPAARTMPPPAPRKSMSMSVAEAMPSPSASMSAVLSKVSEVASVRQPLPAANPFKAHEPTSLGTPPPPPPRGKASATISTPLPIKPPAKLVPLATILPEPEPPPPPAASPMISLAELDDDVAEIVDEPPRLDDVAGVIEERARVVVRSEPPITLPPPRRFEDSLPPLYDDSPRRIAEPRRRSSRKAFGLVALALLLLATTAVLVIVILRKHDRDARATVADRGALVATRDPAPALAAEPPAEVPTEAVTPPVETPPPTEPEAVEVPIAEPATTKPVRAPRSPRPPRDPAEVLAAAPVSPVENGCDEVTCILEKYGRACCARYKPVVTEPAIVARPSSGLPAKLDRRMVQDGIAAVKPVVIACGERSAARGTVKIQVAVSPGGKVQSASIATAPDPELGACVVAAVKLATFGETDEGGSFSYPFVF